jgi:hypothetical protein
MRFAFEVIFVKIYNSSLAVYCCCLRERKNWWSSRTEVRFFLSMKGQKDLIRRRRRITQLSSFVIPFRNKLVVSSSSLLE